MGKYTKAILAVIATVAAGLIAALSGDETISNQEWVNVAILAVGSLGVFAAPNVPGAQYTKAILAVLTAGLTVLASAIVGGLTTTEMLQILVAGLGAVGVYAFKNEDKAVVG